jgi:arylsulfatase A-like enzyme
VITPNLDNLATEAVVFDRAYCTRGVCVPSRTSLMTGLMPRTLVVLANPDRTAVMENAVSMAAILKQNGYQTYAFGKRHLYGSVDDGGDVAARAN